MRTLGTMWFPTNFTSLEGVWDRAELLCFHGFRLSYRLGTEDLIVVLVKHEISHQNFSNDTSKLMMKTNRKD